MAKRIDPFPLPLLAILIISSACASGAAGLPSGPDGGDTVEVDASPPFAADSCTDFIDRPGGSACEFYQCREDETAPEDRCGVKGYYLGYGQKYCDRFQEVTVEHLSPEGVAWVDRVMPCLMRAIEDEVGPETSCESTMQLAFDSHPQCYVESGFCDLSAEDITLIFLTIDFDDFEYSQALTTGVGCLEQWSDQTPP